MTKKVQTFDEFYFLKKEAVIPFTKVLDYINEHDGNLGKYENNIFCPECHAAKLTFVRRAPHPYLKKIPSSSHLIGCSYYFDHASNRLVKSYFDSLNDEQIENKMKAMIRKLNSIKNSNASQSENKLQDNPLLISMKQEEKTQRNYKSLRRKSLSAWLDKEIEGQLCLFYGVVKLQVEPHEKKDKDGNKYYWYSLLIYVKKSQEWVYKTKIYRGGIKDDIDPNKIYNLVVIGKLKFYRDNKFPQIDSLTRKSILIEEK